MNVNRLFLSIVAAAVMLLSAGTVQATPITVANYSFELPDTSIQMTPSLADQGGSGWTWDNALILKPNNFYAPMTATDGDQAVQQHAGLSYQITDYAVSDGDEFTLTIDVGHAPGYTNNYSVGLYFTDPTTGVATSTSGATADIPSGTWQEVTVTYTATADDAGKNIGIRFSGDGVCALFDNVRLNVTPAPEPATMSLLGLGGLGLLLRRKR